LTALDPADAGVIRQHSPAAWSALLGNAGVLFGAGVLIVLVLVALFAPMLFTSDPTFLSPRLRLKPPTEAYWLGTDAFGRDLYSRVVYGARISLMIGLLVPACSIALGLVIGLIAGYVRSLDQVLMRIMDGLMAIPAILLAIAMIALSGASLVTVVVAILVPEIPRVARLVRSVVLTIREEPYIEAAIGVGTPLPLLLIRHVLPNTLAPLIVQGTYIAASAILTEAILSFLGAGIPTEIPTWGNIMAEGRLYFQLAPWIILFPGLFLAITVLAVNLLGDGLRDTLDPSIAKRVSRFR
jgi:peptide/nickel transport system permease protein